MYILFYTNENVQVKNEGILQNYGPIMGILEMQINIS